MSNPRYLTSYNAGIRLTHILGDCLDRATHPMTAEEIHRATGQPYPVVCGFLKKNSFARKVSSQQIPRPGGGKPYREYWRGDRDIQSTFGDVDNMMDKRTSERLAQGERPVAWRDGSHTTWSIDENEALTAVQGNRCLRFGTAQRIDNKSTVVRIATAYGAFTFKKEKP